MTTTHHAVLETESILFIDNAKQWHCENHDTPQTYTQAAETAARFGISTLWITPGYALTANESGGVYTIQEQMRNKRVASVSIWRRSSGDQGRRHHVNLIFLDACTWAHICSAVSPKELLVAIAYVEQVLGIPVTGSSGSMGFSLLKKLHPEWIEEIPINLRDLHFTPVAGPDIIWQRPYETGRYVHKVDGNSWYPYAGTQTDIGVGTPLLLTGAAALRASIHEKGHPQDVGVWNCHVTYNGATYDKDMPPVWREHRGTHAGGEGWLSGPMISLLRSQGHTVETDEGYVFPERHDVLVKWGKFFWQARQSLADRSVYRREAPALIAAKMVKPIANATIGFTAFKHFSEDEQEKRRPDIRLQVVARSRELLWHNINKYKGLYHITPLMVYMDAVYYVTDSPDLAPFGSRPPSEMGGFKYEGHIEMTPAVTRMFDSHMDVASRLEFLNKQGWVK